MNPVGGYFSLELPLREEYHGEALRLNTGRNCLEYVLRARKYAKVYIPYYTCGSILEPFRKLGVSYEFYHVDIHLELARDIHLNPGEALLYANYFGLKQRYVEKLARQHGPRLIVDNTQAFYAKPVAGIDTFYSCRKFFGVPDGAYLYTERPLDVELATDQSYGRMGFLAKRIDLSPEAGYQDFLEAGKALAGQPIRQMSKLTKRMMQGIDYESVAQRRRDNFKRLHRALGMDNNLELPLEEDAVPMAYPCLLPAEDLREKLIERKIFVARYWPNVLEWTVPNDMDHRLASRMQPLPVDQRYGKEEMAYVISNVRLYGTR